MENTAKNKNIDKDQVVEKKETALKKIINYDFSLNKENAPKWIPFIIYLTGWAILYIANTHYSEKTELEINKLSTELKEYRAEYLTTKAQLMFISKQSEVARLVEPLGLKELTEQPKKITPKGINEH